MGARMGARSGNARGTKTIQQQIVEGDPQKRGVHKLQEMKDNEPKPESSYGPCPANLTGFAREAWDLWTTQLEVMHLDKKPDVSVVVSACMAYDRYMTVSLRVKREGMVIKDKTVKDGKVIVLRTKANPVMAGLHRDWNIFFGFCCEFGFTPMSRTRLAMAGNRKVEDKTADASRGLDEVLTAPRKSKVERVVETKAPEPTLDEKLDDKPDKDKPPTIQ